ncbi:glycerophosphodiester phosphodiesterase family protein [Aestuariivivens sediminis]|uniref:glycerophosphodiester phosphodiesterase family protein n=1 Tax=Aestuariivivens sediminis TaxID=2913557 RepID=UPI001F5AD27E|nr:glycerophosphodiester phosphodiesterase family protein [Aestuariivivens sediminis]
MNTAFFKIRVLACISVLLIASCSKNDDAIDTGGTLNTVAAFSISEDNPLVGENIQFTNESTGIEANSSFDWDFGDGTGSTLKNPTHTYNKLGDFIVKLVAKTGESEDTASKELMVSLSNDISGRTSLKNKLNALNGKIMVCAHRGHHLDAPENSLKSITDAIHSGIAMVELDVRQTKDGELVLMHDQTIDRTTNGSGRVSEYTIQELQQYNLYKDNGMLTTEKIPLLKEVLELSRGKIYIDLDIDQKASFNKVYTLVNQYGMLKQVLFYSSEFSVIREMIHVGNNDIIPMPIVRNQNDFNQYDSFNIDVLQFNVNNSALEQQVHSKGWYIFRNAYVNTSTTPQSDNYAQLNEVITIGGRIVQTDNPVDIIIKLQSQNLND